MASFVRDNIGGRPTFTYSEEDKSHLGADIQYGTLHVVWGFVVRCEAAPKPSEAI